MTTLRDKYFEDISSDFLVLSKMIMKQFSLMKSLVDDNTQINIHTEIGQNERIIDSLEVKIRTEVINSIVLYSPRATDLRKIISYYDMTTDLERIGDQILNVAGFLKKVNTGGNIFNAFKEHIVNLMAVAENMTQNAIFAFTYENAALAKETIILDDEADRLHHEIINNLQNGWTEKAPDIQDMVDVLSTSSMSYNLERIGDNATNIAEAAIYLMEGKDIKHAGTKDPESPSDIH